MDGIYAPLAVLVRDLAPHLAELSTNWASVGAESYIAFKRQLAIRQARQFEATDCPLFPNLNTFTNEAKSTAAFLPGRLTQCHNLNALHLKCRVFRWGDHGCRAPEAFRNYAFWHLQDVSLSICRVHGQVSYQCLLLSLGTLSELQIGNSKRNVCLARS